MNYADTDLKASAQRGTGVKPRRGASVLLALISIMALSFIPYLWQPVPISPANAVEIQFSLSTPWPAADGIMPRTGAFLLRHAAAPVLVYSDSRGRVRWMVKGSPELSPLLGCKALNLPFLALDVNGDLDDDLILVSDDRLIYVYDGRRGVQLGVTDWFAESFRSPPSGTLTSPWGLLTASHSSGGKLAAYRGVPVEVLRREAYFNGRTLGPGSFSDCNGDGTEDYVVGTDDGKVVWIDGTSGELNVVDVFSLSLAAEPAIGGSALQLRATIPSVDVTQDGTGEWILLSRQGRLLVFDPEQGVLVHHFQLDDPGPLPPASYPGPLIADLNLDGSPEIIVARVTGGIYAFTISGGARSSLTELWSSDLVGSLSSEPALVDLNGDMVPELVATNTDGELIVMDGRDGKLLYRIRLGAQGPPLVVDSDHDGDLEIVIPTRSSWAVVSTSAMSSPAAEWRQWRGQGNRSGIYVAAMAPSTKPWPSILILVLVAIFSAAFGIRSWTQ